MTLIEMKKRMPGYVEMAVNEGDLITFEDIEKEFEEYNAFVEKCKSDVKKEMAEK